MTDADNITIVSAEPEDLEAVLKLQHLAFQSEAELLANKSIPPLLETLADVENQYRNGVAFLKAITATDRIVGSVRGRIENKTLHIGKLIVHPDWQGRGIGGHLLCAIEERFPNFRYELFTGVRSDRNIKLYEKFGYKCFAQKITENGIHMVYLEKSGSS